jgi:excisionase family DNA binding protein
MELELQKVADQITAKLNAIERYSLLGAKNVLNIDDVAMLTGLSKSHLYKLTCNKQIPHYKPNTKAVYFDRVELENWMKQNRVTTQAEAEQQALAYVVEKGGVK